MDISISISSKRNISNTLYKSKIDKKNSHDNLIFFKKCYLSKILYNTLQYIFDLFVLLFFLNTMLDMNVEWKVIHAFKYSYNYLFP